jgi:ATP phosphoribosyltransferase regulatory subunit
MTAPWLLPDGIEEALPPQTEALERLRGRCIEHFHSWGYELVSPPLVEYLDSLLTGVGNDLDLQTFKITDQLNGRTMGVRADMTPQVARIEAHSLQRDTPVRLCYTGVVLHTRPSGFGRRRNPLQLGAELYGHSGAEADHEILALMLSTLALAGVPRPHIDLGHVGIFRALADACGLQPELEAQLFDALQRKATAEMDELLRQAKLSQPHQAWLRPLVDLNGGIEVLQQARDIYADAPAAVGDALQQLQQMADLAAANLSDTTLHFDLAELRGYAYHTGLVFAAYLPGHGQAIAQGGRYDGIGAVFGRARPATGFSTDLKTLASIGSSADDQRPASCIFAPWCGDTGLTEALAERIAALRADGRRVVSGLPGQTGAAAEMGCSQQLIEQNGVWLLQDIGN